MTGMLWVLGLSVLLAGILVVCAIKTVKDWLSFVWGDWPKEQEKMYAELIADGPDLTVRIIIQDKLCGVKMGSSDFPTWVKEVPFGFYQRDDAPKALERYLNSALNQYFNRAYVTAEETRYLGLVFVQEAMAAAPKGTFAFSEGLEEKRASNLREKKPVSFLLKQAIQKVRSQEIISRERLESLIAIFNPMNILINEGELSGKATLADIRQFKQSAELKPLMKHFESFQKDVLDKYDEDIQEVFAKRVCETW